MAPAPVLCGFVAEDGRDKRAPSVHYSGIRDGRPVILMDMGNVEAACAALCSWPQDTPSPGIARWVAAKQMGAFIVKNAQVPFRV